MSIFVLVSFSAVNGISFSSAFSFTTENEKCIFGRPQYTSQYGLGFGLEMQSLGLGLEKNLKSWSWSWS